MIAGTEINRPAVKRGHRWFAVPKPQTLTDRIAARHMVRSNWVNDSRIPHHGRARVIQNQRHS